MLRRTQYLCVLGVLSTCGAGGKTHGLRGYSLGSVQEAIRWLAGAALALSVALSVVASLACSVLLQVLSVACLLQEWSVACCCKSCLLIRTRTSSHRVRPCQRAHPPRLPCCTPDPIGH